MSNQVGDCFKFLWPFQNIQTLTNSLRWQTYEDIRLLFIITYKYNSTDYKNYQITLTFALEIFSQLSNFIFNWSSQIISPKKWSVEYWLQFDQLELLIIWAWLCVSSIRSLVSNLDHSVYRGISIGRKWLSSRYP